MSIDNGIGERIYPASGPMLSGDTPQFDLLTNPSQDSAVYVVNPGEVWGVNNLPKDRQDNRLLREGFVTKRLLSTKEKETKAQTVFREQMGLKDRVEEMPSSEMSREEAEILAREAREKYESAKLALNGHVAETIIVIGHPTGEMGLVESDKIRAQVFQEKVTLRNEWLGIDMTIEEINLIRGKSVAELRAMKDPAIDQILDELSKRKEAITNLQQAFIQLY